MRKIRFAKKIITMFMKNQMQDKSNIILATINMIARCLIVFLLYHYIFTLKENNINGYNYSTTMWSMFIYFCLMTLNTRKLVNMMTQDIKSGNVEMFINKPISYITLSFYKIIGKGLYEFSFISIVGSIIMYLVLGFPSVNLKIFIPTFIITTFLGILLSLILYAIVGLLAFFIEDSTPIYWMVDKIVMLLGGSYLPITMFPELLKKFTYLNPLGAVNFSTSTVFNYWNDNYLTLILIQIFWIIVLLLIMLYINKLAKEKAMINGG